MSREIFTSWSEYQSGVDRLLALARREICIFDRDLLDLKLDSSARLEPLKSLLLSNQPARLRIALRSADSLQRDCPRLISLLADYAHSMTMQQTTDQLTRLRDSMILVDGCHGLIRFDQSQPRSKLLIDENEELQPYLRRFDEIWNEGGTPLSVTTLGL